MWILPDRHQLMPFERIQDFNVFGSRLPPNYPHGIDEALSRQVGFLELLETPIPVVNPP